MVLPSFLQGWFWLVGWYNIVHCCTTLYNIVQHCTTLYNVSYKVGRWYNIAHCCTTLCNIEQHCTMFLTRLVADRNLSMFCQHSPPFIVFKRSPLLACSSIELVFRSAKLTKAISNEQWAMSIDHLDQISFRWSGTVKEIHCFAIFIPFLSDPGVPGVRSMGPVVFHWLTELPLCRLNWCDSGWWRYELNTNW